MKHTLLFIISLFWIHYSFGQNKSANSLTVSGVVLDSVSAEVIGYATIYNQATSKGTISNHNGFFSLNGFAVNDTLIISYVGYKKKKMVVSQNVVKQVFYLQPNTELLKEVTIYGNDDYLYNMLNDCKKSKSYKTKTAKTYYVLESKINDKQVELVECYYNGEFSNYDAKTLNLKNGRLALSEFNNRFFVSTESSKAVYLHKLFDKNDFFPISPFELKLGKLKSQYKLSLNSKYISDEAEVVYVIDFASRDTLGEHFNGRVWIDSLNSRVIKVNLQVENARIHPFAPLGKADLLTQVDMNISKTYHLVEDEPYVKSIDFDYQLAYRTKDDLMFLLKTDVVLFAYDYNNQFFLPKFDFSIGSYEDYRKINATPYNNFFWDNMDEFGMEEITEKNNLFIKNNSTISNQTMFGNNPYFKQGFFEHPYVFWSEKRIKFKKSAFEQNDFKKFATTVPSERYNLQAQIYMDVNQLNDSLNIITQTIFDPYKSFFHYPLSNEGIAFINMYFDLVEIFRIELEKRLYNKSSIPQINTIHDDIIMQLEVTSGDFFRDVEHGTNKRGMIKWNDFIKERLDIDNINMFYLYNY